MYSTSYNLHCSAQYNEKIVCSTSCNRNDFAISFILLRQIFSQTIKVVKKFRLNFQLYLLQIIQTMNNLTAGCWSVFEACHAWISHTTILKASFAISERLKMLHSIRQRAVSLQLNRYDGIRIVKLNTDGILTKTIISLSPSLQTLRLCHQGCATIFKLAICRVYKTEMF